MKTIAAILITSIVAIGLVATPLFIPLRHSITVFAQQTPKSENKTNASNSGGSQNILTGNAPKTQQFPGGPVTTPSSNGNKSNTNAATTTTSAGGGAAPTTGGSSSSSGNNTLAPTADCSAVASQLGGKATSNGSVCSVFIVRQSPIVKSHDGMPLNNFVVASNMIEIMPTSAAATNATSSTSGQNTNRINGTINVMVMGEFALLEPELVPVQKVLDQKVNITAIHNHMVMESPKLINVHWEAHGQLTPIIQLVKEAIRQTSIMGGSISATTSGAGGGGK